MIQIALGRRGTDLNRTVAVKFDQQIFVNQRGGRPENVDGVEAWQSKGEIKGDGQTGGDGQGDFCHVIAIDPFNNDIMLAGAQNLFRTINGGNSWAQVAGYYPDGTCCVGGVHPDQQSVIFDDRWPGVVYLCNDGGVFRSTDRGATWTDFNTGLITAQFYHMGVSGDRAVSNMFHQGIAETKDMSRRQWLAKGFGWEFSQVYGDPKRTDFFYIFDKPAGRLWRKRLPEVGTRDFVTIGEFKPPGVDYGWSIAVDTRPSSDTLLLGTDNPAQILRSLNGHSDSPKWNTEPGITIDKEAIVSIAFAPSKPGMAYAVSGSGRVFRKYDVNTEKKWVEMGRWPGGNVTQLVVNPLHENRIYLMTWDKVVPVGN